MKFARWFATSFVFCAAASFQNSSSAQSAPPRFLVRANATTPEVFAPGANARTVRGATRARLQSMAKRAFSGAFVGRSFERSGWNVLAVASKDEKTVLKRLKTLFGAANVASNDVLKLAATPNDPRFVSQWHLPKIGAPLAWDRTTGSSSIIVAVLDTGVDLQHPDLQPNLWRNSAETNGIAGLDDDENGYIDDICGANTVAPTQKAQDDYFSGHGTHVAGVVGAVGNNGIGGAGLNWKIKIVPLKIFDASGFGTTADAIEGLEYVLALKARGVAIRATVNSWSQSQYNFALESAFGRLGAAGILSFAAAGNGGSSLSSPGGDIDIRPQYPAAFSDASIVSVASSDENDARSVFSNFGAQNVDIAAPGSNIWSLAIGGGEQRLSGTSMATPMVAGAAALVWSVEPNLSAAQMKTRLLATVDPIPGWKTLCVSGGRLNLARALQIAAPTPTPIPTATPTPTPVPLPFLLDGVVYRRENAAPLRLAGAVIRLDGEIRASSDRYGRFRIPNLAPGTYALTARLNGFVFQPRTVTSNGNGHTIRREMEGVTTQPLYSIRGQTLDAANAPLSGATIWISGAPGPVALSDLGGRFLISSRVAGTYTVSGVAPDGRKLRGARAILPTQNQADSPDASVVLRDDFSAPLLTIQSPTNGANIVRGAYDAAGTAQDLSGVSEMRFVLSRTFQGAPTYWNWVSKRWIRPNTHPDIILVRKFNAPGVSWRVAIPDIYPTGLTLQVWARDSYGNTTPQNQAATSTWNVVAPNPSAPTF